MPKYTKYKSISLPKYLVPEDEALNAEAERWAAAGRDAIAERDEVPWWTPPEAVGPMLATPELLDRCKEALDFAADASAAYNLPFDENSKLALKGLGTGEPKALQITDYGMKIADDFLSKNNGIFHADVRRSTPELKIGKAKFGFYNSGEGERIIGPQPDPLGALLGEATVMRDPSGKVIGISDQFDYDPANHKGVTRLGMSIVNDRITRDCPDRIPFVQIRGGRPIPGER